MVSVLKCNIVLCMRKNSTRRQSVQCNWRIPSIAYAISWMAGLFQPLLVCVIIALILNVPLSFIEHHLFTKRPTPKKDKAKRPLGILLSLILVLGIFIGVAVLVIPELVNAVTMVSVTVMDMLDQMSTLKNSTDFSTIPFGEYLSRIDIDWIELRNDLDAWVKEIRNTAVGKAGNVLSEVVSYVVDGVIGFVFSIYILANKEKLKCQIGMLTLRRF